MTNSNVPTEPDETMGTYPHRCYDCGSIRPHFHTAACDMAGEDDDRSVPSKPGTQHITDEAFAEQQAVRIAQRRPTGLDIRTITRIRMAESGPTIRVSPLRQDEVGVFKLATELAISRTYCRFRGTINVVDAQDCVTLEALDSNDLVAAVELVELAVFVKGL